MKWRNRFLHPPAQGELVPQDHPATGFLALTLEKLEQVFPTGMNPRERENLLRQEATYSAAIEHETNPHRIEQHHRALARFLQQPLCRESLLELHRTMMAAQRHAEPGCYRSRQVIIGPHRPPGPALVPALMEELFEFLDENRENRVARAAWAHVQFETIHPFSDGNGRAGRALLTHVLGAPVPLSLFILQERPEYYRLFEQADWTSWMNWIARGVMQQIQARRETTD